MEIHSLIKTSVYSVHVVQIEWIEWEFGVPEKS